MGQKEVFEEGEESFKEMMHLEISAKQIQRVSEHYGQQIDRLVQKNCSAVIPKLATKQPHEVTYVMLDGSMIMTRETKEPWKEMKLGRVFHASQIIDIHKNRKQVYKGVYVSHLGSVDKFFPKFEYHLTDYNNKVIIADGAKWIWNWVESNYPGSVQILDFYHAKDKLIKFAKHQFKQEDKREKWQQEQIVLLHDSKVLQVIQSVNQLRPRNPEALKAKETLLTYYIEHEDRMQYKSFKEQGLLIGSGPIESAHRSVIQQRLKLSGQRWSIPGAQAIANLRTLKKSESWNAVVNLIRKAA